MAANNPSVAAQTAAGILRSLALIAGTLSVLTLSVLTTAAGAGELTASLEAQYPVTPQVAWKKLGDFAALADWHPMVSLVTVKGSGVGAVRTVTWSNGATLVERLTAIDGFTDVDDQTGSMTTTLVMTSLSITNYASQLKVEAAPDTPGSCVVTWSSTFEADGISDKEAKELMLDYYQKGLDALAIVFGD